MSTQLSEPTAQLSVGAATLRTTAHLGGHKLPVPWTNKTSAHTHLPRIQPGGPLKDFSVEFWEAA